MCCFRPLCDDLWQQARDTNIQHIIYFVKIFKMGLNGKKSIEIFYQIMRVCLLSFICPRVFPVCVRSPTINSLQLNVKPWAWSLTQPHLIILLARDTCYATPHGIPEQWRSPLSFSFFSLTPLHSQVLKFSLDTTSISALLSPVR